MQVLKLACLTALLVATNSGASADEWRWHNGRWYVYRTPPGAPGLEAGNPFAPGAGTGVMTPQRDGPGPTAPPAGHGSTMAATGIDLQRLESRIVTLQLANAVKRIHERLGMKSEVNDGTLPLSLLGLRQPGASDSLIMELIAQQVANAGASSNATNCTSTAAAVMPTPAVISIDPEVQASQTMLELLQMWRAERDSQKAVNDNFQAKLKELEEVQAKRSADRKARLEEIQKKINELKPKS